MSKQKMNQYDAVFFSPHLDDVVLSCGGLLARLRNQKKRALVVTVFSRGQELVSKSTDLQQFLKQAGVRNTEELFAARKQEDERAAQHLSFDLLHLSYVDALWRTEGTTPLYPTFTHIFEGPVAAADGALLHELQETFGELIRTQKHTASLYGPLGIGRHIDHRLTFKALFTISRHIPNPVFFYEDIPYRNQIGAPERRVAELNIPWKLSQFHASGKEAGAKETALEHYATQIPWLKEAGLGTRDYYHEKFRSL